MNKEQLIKDYAHDYRNMNLDENHFGAMLREFTEALCTQVQEEQEEIETIEIDYNLSYFTIANREKINEIIRKLNKINI